jgi:hypothetical protein
LRSGREQERVAVALEAQHEHARLVVQKAIVQSREANAVGEQRVDHGAHFVFEQLDAARERCAVGCGPEQQLRVQ